MKQSNGRYIAICGGAERWNLRIYEAGNRPEEQVSLIQCFEGRRFYVFKFNESSDGAKVRWSMAKLYNDLMNFNINIIKKEDGYRTLV